MNRSAKPTELTACPTCGSVDFSVIDRRTLPTGLHRVVLCASCGMVWVNPRFSHQRYLDFYRADYTSAVYGLDDHPEKIRDVIAWRTRRSEQKFRAFPKFWKRGMRVLEIGAGIGAFMHALTEAYGCETWGIEPSPSFVKLARQELKLHVFQGSYDDWSASRPRTFPSRYDRIVMDQILEHMPDPATFLSSLHEHLTDRGALFISVPCIATPKERRKDFFIFEHLSSFSPFPLALLLARCGFKVTGMFLERPGSLQMTAVPFASPEPMLPFDQIGKPLTKQEIDDLFVALEKKA